MDEALRGRWERLAGLLGVDEAEAVEVLRDLWRRHDEPQRAYHRLSHIGHLLEVIDLLREEEVVDDPVAVQLAAWFHDAIYAPGAPDNESRSAALADEVLTGWGLLQERVEHVVRLINATAAHTVVDAETDPDTAVLIDADLAILAADPDTYDVYRRAVRVEHAALDDAAWRAGRVAFIRGLLARPLIFSTAGMRRRGEVAARRNLHHELALLESGG